MEQEINNRLDYWKEQAKKSEGEYKGLCLKQIKYLKEIIEVNNGTIKTNI